MTQTEHNWTEENTMQQQEEETQRQRNKMGYLKTEQQQQDINKLTAEKHEQDLLIKRLRSKIEYVLKKLEENKNEATQKKIQLMKMWTEIYQEREILDKRHQEILSERHLLETIKYDKTKSLCKELGESRDVKVQMRMSRRKEKFSKIKKETKECVKQRSEQDLQVEKQGRADEQKLGLEQEQNNTEMKRVILEVEETRQMLSMVREDTERRKRDSIDEKSQIKWAHFQAKKKQRKLDQWLEKMTIERDELEIIKKKTQQQREKLEQKLSDTITTVLTMGEIKTHIENVAKEMNNTREEMLQTQREMQNNKKEVKTYMVSNAYYVQ